MAKSSKQIRYHISKAKGEPAICDAEYKCPFGDMVIEHYDSREEAMDAYEEKQRINILPSTRGSDIKITSIPASMRIDENTLIVPRGVYVLGDPTFTAGKDAKNWDKWKKVSGKAKGNGMAFGAFMNGHLVACINTKEGDGTFIDNEGRTFPVDGGMLGFTSLSFLKKQGLSYDEIMKSGIVVSVEEPTEIKYDYGILSFGPNIDIFTDNDMENDKNLYDISDLEDVEEDLTWANSTVDEKDDFFDDDDITKQRRNPYDDDFFRDDKDKYEEYNDNDSNSFFKSEIGF